MTISELIEQLQDMQEQYGEDAEVRLMTQQNWPFENAILGVTSGREMNEECGEEGDDDVEKNNMVYIVEGRQICYGSKRAWDAF